MKRITTSLTVLLLALLAAACSEPDGIANSDERNLGKKPGSTPSAPVFPIATSVSPGHAEIGDEVTITGSNFDYVQKYGSFVTIDGVAGTVYSKWTKTEIRVLVPSGRGESYSIV